MTPTYFMTRSLPILAIVILLLCASPAHGGRAASAPQPTDDIESSVARVARLERIDYELRMLGAEKRQLDAERQCVARSRDIQTMRNCSLRLP